MSNSFAANVVTVIVAIMVILFIITLPWAVMLILLVIGAACGLKRIRHALSRSRNENGDNRS